MTVSELRNRLDGIDFSVEVALYREVDHITSFYPISDVQLRTGKPLRHPDGSIGLKFDSEGSAKWLLLLAEED